MGIDVGVAQSLTISDGRVVHLPVPTPIESMKQKRLHRRVAPPVQGSPTSQQGAAHSEPVPPPPGPAPAGLDAQDHHGARLTAALAVGVLVPVLQGAQTERLVALIGNGLNDPGQWVRASCVIDWYGLGRSVSDLPDLIGGLLLAGDAHLAEEFLTTADQLDPDRSIRTATITAVRDRLGPDVLAVVDRWLRSP